MTVENVMRWYTRFSLLYAVGTWTMLFSLMKHSNRLKDFKEEELTNPNVQVFQGKYWKIVMVGKENFVPYSTRIKSLFPSFTGRNNAPQDSSSSSNDYDEEFFPSTRAD